MSHESDRETPSYPWAALCPASGEIHTNLDHQTDQRKERHHAGGEPERPRTSPFHGAGYHVRQEDAGGAHRLTTTVRGTDRSLVAHRRTRTVGPGGGGAPADKVTLYGRSTQDASPPGQVR